MLVHKLIKPIPRNMLQNLVQYAILMPHGVDPPLVSRNVAKRSEHR